MISGGLIIAGRSALDERRLASEVCECMSRVCDALDKAGNRNGVAEIDELPLDSSYSLNPILAESRTTDLTPVYWTVI